jgi:aryl-alcohol dehydrogenase-like predicted oxidoreductase
VQYRPLGRSGLMVSVVGQGCNNFGLRITFEAARAVVEAALDEGVNFFDTADVYGGVGRSEEVLGELLEGRRDEVLIATKFGVTLGGAIPGDHGARGSRAYVRRAIEASLRRLRTDYIDLYQYHQPDGVTPIEETLGAMSELVAEGKVRYIGSSQMAAWQVVDADWTARSRGSERFVSAQNEYSLLNQSVERELGPACAHLGIGILPFYPLASGLLTGKYRRGEQAADGTRMAARPEVYERADWDHIEALEAFAAEAGRSLLELAIGGLAARPAVASVIAGATGPEQVRANVAAGVWVPSADEAARLAEIRETVPLSQM